MELSFVCPVLRCVFSSARWEAEGLAVVRDRTGRRCLGGLVRGACPLCGGWHEYAPEELACPLTGVKPGVGEDCNGKGGA